MLVALVAILFSSFSSAGMNRLQYAISQCQIETVRTLLQEGADANAKDARGRPILSWLASGRKCDDRTALATATLLEEFGGKFERLEGSSKPSLMVNLAARGMPNTLSFLGKKCGSGSSTDALRAISKKNDLASIRALLSAGADPLAGEALTSALFDAAASRQGASLLEMLKHVTDRQSPKVMAAYEIARKKEYREIVQIFLDTGTKPVEPVADRRKNPCQPQALTSAQARLLTRLELPNGRGLSGLAGAMTCKFIQECGDVILVDCNSAADGPAYYINQKTLKLIATCGGACMKGCTDCPPKEWACECKF